MIYVYAVCHSGGAGPSGVGLCDRPLRVVIAGALAAVVSDHPDTRPVPDADALWRHERVVEDLMSSRELLPMRFGSVLGDDHAAADLLAERAEELGAALARVTGAIELGVRVAWAAPDADAATPERSGPGTAYLDGLRQRRRRATELAERIDPPLRALSRASRHRLLATSHLPLSGAYLVDRGRLDAFCSRVVALDEEIGETEIVCTGPWPPYSFVGAQERQA